MSDPQYILCPYCGHLQRSTDRCGECGGVFEPLSRKATQIAMGPWYIRDKRLPFRPGCSFEVLKKQVQAGRVTPNTVLRGPTTRQFWSVARNVPGVAHLLGVCHKCGTKVSPKASECPSCKAVFKEPTLRNELGLAYATARAAEEAQMELNEEIEALTAPTKSKRGQKDGAARPDGPRDTETTRAADKTASRATRPGENILQEVLGSPDRGSGSKSRSRSLIAASKKEPSAATVPQALDFTPGEEPAPPGMSSTTLLLISLNAIFLVLLGLLLWYISSRG